MNSGMTQEEYLQTCLTELRKKLAESQMERFMPTIRTLAQQGYLVDFMKALKEQNKSDFSFICLSLYEALIGMGHLNRDSFNTVIQKADISLLILFYDKTRPLSQNHRLALIYDKTGLRFVNTLIKSLLEKKLISDEKLGEYITMTRAQQIEMLLAIFLEPVQDPVLFVSDENAYLAKLKECYPVLKAHEEYKLSDDLKLKVDGALHQAYVAYTEMVDAFKSGKIKMLESFEEKDLVAGPVCSYKLVDGVCINVHLKSLRSQLFFCVYNEPSEKLNFPFGTDLIKWVANTEVGEAMRYLSIPGLHINDYNYVYGNTALLIAVAKGYEHIDDHQYTFNNQKILIDTMLGLPQLEINAIHLQNGMTALHIACLRGDSPALIKRLLGRGANSDLLDFKGRRPEQLLESTYEDTQKFIQSITGETHVFTGHLSHVATLPTPEQRERNIEGIRAIFAELKRDRESAAQFGKGSGFHTAAKESVESSLSAPMPTLNGV